MTSGKCKVKFESNLFIYLAKFVLLVNLKINFDKEEGGASPKNKLKQPIQFMIKFFESYV